MNYSRLAVVVSGLVLVGSLAFPQKGGTNHTTAENYNSSRSNTTSISGGGLLQRPDVQNELKLTIKQKSEIQEKLASMKTDFTRLEKSISKRKRRAKKKSMRVSDPATEMDRTIMRILNDTQYKRYKELLY